jgi:ABC-type multidrug transport system ATPase subunit
MTQHTTLLPDAVSTDVPPPRGVSITAVGLTTVHPNGTRALDDVSLTLEPGQLTAIIGPSGAGKTTLLGALAGVAPAQSGTVSLHRGTDAPAVDTRIAYVPQEDVLHGELPLRRTLRYSAALRLDTSPELLRAAVDEAMETLGLSAHGDVRVDSLSGGQRKRASIAAEILTHPEVCLLDEPTSGLDPAAASDLLACLQRMCDGGRTVIFTTHSIQDIERCHRVVVLAPGGRLVAVGTPTEVLARSGVQGFAELYTRLADRPVETPQEAVRPTSPSASALRARPARRPACRPSNRSGPSGTRQWLVLTRRSFETIIRNRLTLAILLGSPAAVIAMFAVLFRPGGFAVGSGDPTASVMVAYWLAFAGFFFGLIFGLLQVCSEVAVLRREHHAGVRTGAYLLAKVALLTPFLLIVNATMIVVLQALDRLPALSVEAHATLFVTMGLNAVAALCLGLLASAVVTSTAQAALALPMLCFPAVLFSGAMVPVPVMAGAGRAIAAVMPDRWAFEAIAQHLDVAALVGPGSPYAGLGASSNTTYWALLAVFVVVLGSLAQLAVERRAAGVDR